MFVQRTIISTISIDNFFDKLPQPAEQKVLQTQQQQPVEPVEQQQQQLQDITEVVQSSEQQPSENANGDAMETSGIEQPPRRRPWFRRSKFSTIFKYILEYL